jgi:tetratricopeptide (TPR) repeat protein
MAQSRTLQEGIAFFQQGDFEEAVQIFTEILKKNPKEAAAYLWMGNCSVLVGNLKIATEHFRKAFEFGNPEMKAEARRQLRTLQFNRLLQFLVFRPPMLWLLLIGVIGYGTSQTLAVMQWTKTATWIHHIAVYGVIPLFFFWASFIPAFFVGNLAFSPQSQGKPRRTARAVLILCAVLLIPAHLLASRAIGVLVLSIAIDFFLLSTLLGRILIWTGERITGEEMPLFLGSGEEE